MKKINAADNHQKMQTLCNHILEEKIMQKTISKEINSILKDLNISEIDLLKMMKCLRSLVKISKLYLKIQKIFNHLKNHVFFIKKLLKTHL